MRKTLKTYAALSMAAVVSLAAFASSATAMSEGGGTTNVKLTSFKITMDKTSFKKGTVTFKVSNSSGGTVHGFCVRGGGIDKCTSNFTSGKKTLKVSFKKAGTYTTYCPVGSHEDEGMKKKIKVS